MGGGGGGTRCDNAVSTHRCDTYDFGIPYRRVGIFHTSRQQISRFLLARSFYVQHSGPKNEHFSDRSDSYSYISKSTRYYTDRVLTSQTGCGRFFGARVLSYSPFRTAVSFWGHLGTKHSEFEWFVPKCPQNGTAVLEGLTTAVNKKRV